MKKPWWLLIVLLSGCGVITDEEIGAAESACAPHRGLRNMSPAALSGWYEVICNDGTKIEGRVQK